MKRTGPPRIVDEIFAEWRPNEGFTVPLTRYQEFTAHRNKYEGRLDDDPGRFMALMWYIETYALRRRPTRAPFSGRQVAWLLESNDSATEAWPLPRVVEWFRRRATQAPASPYGGDIGGYLDIAYWWSATEAVRFGVEHALVPDAFVAALSASSSDERAVQVSEFLLRYAAAHPEVAWSFGHEAGRLGAYMAMLDATDGVYFGLFAPAAVLRRIVAISQEAAALAGVGPDVRDRLAARAAESLAYRTRHTRLRSGAEDISAALQGEDWLNRAYTPPSPPRGVEPRARVGTSALPFPVRVIGPVNSNSGLGQATRRSLEALEAAGVRAEPVDFPFDNPAPRSAHYASTTPSAAAFAVNLIHLSAESLPLAPAYLPSVLFEEAFNIGYFFWELPQPALCHDLALRQVDELWVASEFNRDVYAPHTPAPVLAMGMPLAPPTPTGRPRAEVRAAHGLPDDVTVFVTTFDAYSFMSRKNPAGALRAFLRAFPAGSEPVRLVVKTHNLSAMLSGAGVGALRREVLSLCGCDTRILLIDETLPYADLLSLKAACDVYVSLHRSEGWGFGMIESMQLGLPSIATAHSGNMDFCSADSTWLVPWTKRYLEPEEYIFVRPGDWWAEPDLAAAAAAMREAAADPAATRARGEAARAHVEARFSAAAVGARYLQRLRLIKATAPKV